MIKKYTEKIWDYIDDSNEFWLVYHHKIFYSACIYLFLLVWAALTTEIEEILLPDHFTNVFRLFIYNEYTYWVVITIITAVLITRKSFILTHILHIMAFFSFLTGAFLFYSGILEYMRFAGLYFAFPLLIILFVHSDDLRKVVMNYYAVRSTRGKNYDTRSHNRTS